jgi:probable HAF family extracellular repeat protein
MTLSQYFNVRHLILAAALTAGLGPGDHANAQEQRAFLVDLNSRTVTEFGTLDGNPIQPTAINDVGQVVGYSYAAERRPLSAFITGPDGMGVRDLGTLREIGSRAFDLNDTGQVVGDSPLVAEGRPGLLSTHAFITGPNGMGMRDLGTLGGSEGDNSHAFGINDAGQVVGNSTAAEPPRSPHAFITGPDGMGMRDLGTLVGGYLSSASEINNAGQVVGYSVTATGEIHAFITGPDGLGMRDLGTLGGGNSVAVDINGTGWVVGYSYMPTEGPFPYHAFITGPHGAGIRDLGTLGGNSGFATGINDAGQVVGWAETAEGSIHAFITRPEGRGMMDLNSLVDLPEGWVLTNASDITNNGQMIATGVIPEPETYALMLAGLGLVGLMARHRKAEGRVSTIRFRATASALGHYGRTGSPRAQSHSWSWVCEASFFTA